MDTVVERQLKYVEEEDKRRIKSVAAENSFQVPLHYPRYTKANYEVMAESVVDRLLAEYGLPIMGDLAYKRKFAMGAFLWPDERR